MDLPRIEAVLKREAWIWESAESGEEPTSRSSRFVWGESDTVIHEPSEHEE
jgi:hypothetical protein